uniref:Uncharacterized protein n=1 Tax=Timema cristinae TaxID=61476 RepID=A0A7R9H132_TIMCR|nr:unnamed protein product [Timema cristinae]
MVLREGSSNVYVVLQPLGQLLTYLVKVEGEFPRNGAVESGLEVSGPVLTEDVLATRVLLADPGHPRVHALPAVNVLHGGLPEEEEHVLSHVVCPHEVWLCEVLKNTARQTKHPDRRDAKRSAIYWFGYVERMSVDPVTKQIYEGRAFVEITPEGRDVINSTALPCRLYFTLVSSELGGAKWSEALPSATQYVGARSNALLSQWTRLPMTGDIELELTYFGLKTSHKLRYLIQSDKKQCLSDYGMSVALDCVTTVVRHL